ncbi:MAG: FkbM family methyltransferase [Epsilonproteobacteria bacterium]|nr:MAG: FkbM family methyltransferase [Campylobacterota bacterium]
MKNIVNTDHINQKDVELTRLFVSSTKVPKYILGVNKLTKSVQKYVRVDGVVDDFTRVQTSRNKAILDIDDIAKDGIVIVVSTASPLEVAQKLDDMGIDNLNYTSFYRYATFKLIAPPFMIDFADDFARNRDKYEAIYNILSDNLSKTIFEKIINFKLTFDIKFMRGFTNDHKEQYFDKTILPDMPNIVFVDGGGYIGDTARQVVKLYPNFQKIYLIEPNQKNITIAKKRLKDIDNIEFANIGLSNQKATLNFDDDRSYSTIYGAGATNICVDSLDNIITQKVDFIKLDIEGAEQDAIEGARQTIARYTPVIACCIYHKADDWHKIPQKVLSINDRYNIYMRHYMEGIFETVMYFVPKTT